MPIEQRKPIWEKIKVYLETGLSYSKIIDNIEHKYNVKVSSTAISDYKKENRIEKGKTEDLKHEIIDLENKKRTISEQETNTMRKLSSLNDFEITTLNEIVSDEMGIKSLIFNTTVLNIIRTNEHLTNNKKLEKVNVGDGVQNFEEVGLGSVDYKNIQDTLDKASQTVGVNPRFNNSQVTVNTQNNLETNTVLNKEVVQETLESFNNEY